MHIVTLSFPIDVPCGDKHCPINEYGQHSHTFYNQYDIPKPFHMEGMSEQAAAADAISVRFNESTPANNKKGALQNV